jgi:hypothetical protein
MNGDQPKVDAPLKATKGGGPDFPQSPESIQGEIADEVTAKGSSKSNVSKRAMQDAADAIIKICGNTSILINQIVPSNFVQYWEILTPLMKDRYQTPGPDSQGIKDELFKLVVTRDNIGEAMWYIYTGILLTSIVQLKLTSRGCASNPKTMEENYKKFLEAENQAKAQQAKVEGTTYTMSG